MGRALVEASLALGHETIVVSGPVEVDYPEGATVIPVVSTEEMLAVAREAFRECDGVIGAAAPCDYRPLVVESQKISKTGEPLSIRLVETPDVLATLGEEKRSHQWAVAFALETEDQRFRALTKLEKKNCDMVVLNGPDAMNADTNSVEILVSGGAVIDSIQGQKADVAKGILRLIQTRLIDKAQR